MPYLASSAPLPQNSLMPPSADEVNRSNARLLRDFMESRTGRERLYSTLPTPDQFWSEGPGLAVDANKIIGDSESARESILIGLGLPTNLEQAALSDIAAAAPTVVSLNAPTTTSGLSTTQSGLMPAAAPVPSVGKLWSAPGASAGTGNRHTGRTGVKSSLRLGGGADLWDGNDPGPGCSASILVQAFPLPTIPAPAPAANPPAPASQPALRPPTYSNICWALRNGVVLQAQVSAAVLQACSQLGYAGACPPPAGNDAEWMAQQTTFPPIALTAAEIAAIPPAPPSIGPCTSSYQLGGMAGVALNWGDAGLQQPSTQASSGAWPWILLLGGVAALVIMDRKKGRQ